MNLASILWILLVGISSILISARTFAALPDPNLRPVSEANEVVQQAFELSVNAENCKLFSDPRPLAFKLLSSSPGMHLIETCVVHLRSALPAGATFVPGPISAALVDGFEITGNYYANHILEINFSAANKTKIDVKQLLSSNRIKINLIYQGVRL